MMVETVENVLVLLAILCASVLAAAVAGDLLRRRRDRSEVERLAARGPRADETGDRDEEPEGPVGPIARRLRAAGLHRVSPLTYLAASAVLAIGGTVALRALLPTTPWVAASAAVVAVVLLWLLIGFWGRRRAHRFEIKLADALALMIGALRAGENLVQAFDSAGEAAEGAVKKEFREVAYRLSLGMNVRRALRRIDQGYDSQGTRLFTRTIAAKWEAGGELAPVLETINRVIRERLRIRWRLQSQLAGARLATVLIALIPYLLIPFLLWQRPDWIERVRYHPLGPKLFFAAVLLQLVSLLWLRRIMRIEL